MTAAVTQKNNRNGPPGVLPENHSRAVHFMDHDKLRARVKASTRAAPERRSCLAQAVMVDPVVNTSSINNTFLPATLSGWRTEKAWRRFFRRADPERLVWGGVLRSLQSTLAGIGTAVPKQLLARSRAWLKPRSFSRFRCRGTGRIRSGGERSRKAGLCCAQWARLASSLR